MNLKELLSGPDGLRKRLDDEADPQLWSDEELTSYLNDAVRQVCMRQRCLIESQNTRLCRLAVKAGQQLVKVPREILAIRTARYIEGGDTNQSQHPLEITTTKRMLKWRPRWEIEGVGKPEYLITDYQERHIALSCTPEFAGVITLVVWRKPLAEEALCKNDDEPVIDDNWHIDLLDWAEHRAYGKNDTEVNDAARSAAAEATFTAKVGRLPTAAEIRLWGVARIRGTTAEFL